jgi:spermidine synthase
VVVAELLQVVIDWNQEYLREVNGLCLADPRVEIRKKDVFKILPEKGKYDAI